MTVRFCRFTPDTIVLRTTPTARFVAVIHVPFGTGKKLQKNKNSQARRNGATRVCRKIKKTPDESCPNVLLTKTAPAAMRASLNNVSGETPVFSPTSQQHLIENGHKAVYGIFARNRPSRIRCFQKSDKCISSDAAWSELNHLWLMNSRKFTFRLSGGNRSKIVRIVVVIGLKNQLISFAEWIFLVKKPPSQPVLGNLRKDNSEMSNPLSTANEKSKSVSGRLLHN